MTNMFSADEMTDMEDENENHLPSLATIERNNPTQTASKGWKDNWSTIHTNRPCRFKQDDNAAEDIEVQGRKVRRVPTMMTFTVDTDLKPEDRITIGGVVYIAVGVGVTDKRTKKTVKAFER